jgi:hypothetical protein
MTDEAKADGVEAAATSEEVETEIVDAEPTDTPPEAEGTPGEAAPASEATEDAAEGKPQLSDSDHANKRRKEQLRKEKQRNRELEAKNREIENRLAAVEAAKAASATAPLVRPQPENFHDEYEYQRARDNYNREQTTQTVQAELAKQQQNQAQQSEHDRKSAAMATFQTRADTYAESNDDYDEVTTSISDIVGRSPAMTESIIEEEDGPALYMYLGNHPEEAQRIAALPPQAAIRAMGKLAGKMASDKAAANPKRVSKAPPVGKTVNTQGASASSGEITNAAREKMSDTDAQADFDKRQLAIAKRQ